MIPPKIGRYGWIGILSVVLGVDIPVLISNEVERRKNELNSDYNPVYIKTMSEWCWEAVEHPIKRWLVFAIIVILVKHLAAPKILRRYDPIGVVGFGVKVIINRGQ